MKISEKHQRQKQCQFKNLCTKDGITQETPTARTVMNMGRGITFPTAQNSLCHLISLSSFLYSRKLRMLHDSYCQQNTLLFTCNQQLKEYCISLLRAILTHTLDENTMNILYCYKINYLYFIDLCNWEFEMVNQTYLIHFPIPLQQMIQHSIFDFHSITQ